MNLNIRRARWIALLAVMAAAISAPAVVMAQSGGDEPVPENARTLLPESRWAELYCLEARWQVEAAHQSVTEIETTLNSIDPYLRAISARTELPDYAAMRARLDAELAAVCDAETARAARDAAVNLSARIREQVGVPLEDLSARLRQRLAAARGQLEQQIRTSVNNYFASERATHETRLRQEFDAQVANRLDALGREPTQADRDAIAVSARAYARQLADQIQIQVETQAQLLAEQLRTDAETKLRAASNELNALSTRLRNRTSNSLSATAQTHLNDALQARRDAVLVIVDWRTQQLRAGIAPRLAGLTDERIREVQAVLDDIDIDRDQLRQALDSAIAVNDRAAFETASRAFQEKWGQRQADFDETRLAATIACEAQLEGIEVALSGAARLRGALPDGTRLPQVYQDRLAAIRSALDELDDAAADFRAACESGESSGADVLVLIDRLRAQAATANGGLAEFRATARGGTR